MVRCDTFVTLVLVAHAQDGNTPSKNESILFKGLLKRLKGYWRARVRSLKEVR